MDNDSDVSTISTPILPHTMSRNSFEAIWQAWHFCDTGIRAAVQNLACLWIFCTEIEVSLQPKTTTVTSQNHHPMVGSPEFRTYNPGKIKYGVLVKMVCEAVSGYICNMEMYSGKGKKLQDTVLSLLDRNLGQNHHIYEDNFYKSVRLAWTLLDRSVRVCGMVRATRGIPCDLEGEGKHLKKWQSAFRKKGDNGASVEEQKTCANDKYDPWDNNCKHRMERLENKHANIEALIHDQCLSF
jgi:hypothetical protein